MFGSIQNGQKKKSTSKLENMTPKLPPEGKKKYDGNLCRENKNVKANNRKYADIYEDVKLDDCFCIKSIHVDVSFGVLSALTSRDSVTSKAIAVLRKQKANFTRR